MKVGICDDDTLWCQKVKEIIENYGVEKGILIQFYIFSSKIQLQNFKEVLDILFLDIEIENTQGEKELGTEIALDVNKRWPFCQIVYLTNYLFYATEVYESAHMYFVLKEQIQKKIDEIFHKMKTIMKNRQQKFMFEEIGGNIVTFLPEEILYFERSGRITNLVSASQEIFKIPYKMDELENKILNSDFLRCHNSYIVYMPAIQEIRKNELVLHDHTIIMISRGYMKGVKNRFMEWIQQQLL